MLASCAASGFVFAAGPTLLFLQENAGNISHRLIPIQYLMDRLECNVFMLSYRGYGESEGTPSEKGLRADAQAALDHLLTREDIDPKTVFAFGRSLGGAVAAQLVHDNPGKLRGLILENTFTSIIDMVGKMFPFLRHVVGAGKPLNFLVRSKWHTLGIIGDIQEPVLLLSGSLDEMVPPHHMKELHRAASNAKLVEFEQGMHMDTWLKGGKRYWQEMDDFINVAGSPRQAVGERGLRRRVTGEPGSSAGPARRVEASEQKDMGFETVKNDKTFSSVVD
eukprot:jgi/Mesvir1/23929/Mv10704-RA.1